MLLSVDAALSIYRAVAGNSVLARRYEAELRLRPEPGFEWLTKVASAELVCEAIHRRRDLEALGVIRGALLADQEAHLARLWRIAQTGDRPGVSVSREAHTTPWPDYLARYGRALLDEVEREYGKL